MTVDITTGGAVAVPRQGAPTRLVEWAAEAQAAHSLATSISRTAFCPDVFRNKPDEATAAMLAGYELGLSPLAALNAFDVIQGRPAPKAITLRAIALSHGHDLWPGTMTPEVCVMFGRRRGTSEIVEVRWDMKRARDMKLTNKPNWQNQPQAMLIARATSECARLIAADALLGVPYSAEELADLEPVPTVTVARAEPPKRTVRRAPSPAPVAEEPPLDEPTPEPVPVGDAPEAITAPQLKKLHVVLNEQGLGDRDAALKYLSAFAGRDIASSKDLTKAEASEVIDALEQSPAEPTLDDASWSAVTEVPA